MASEEGESTVPTEMSSSTQEQQPKAKSSAASARARAQARRRRILESGKNRMDLVNGTPVDEPTTTTTTTTTEEPTVVDSSSDEITTAAAAAAAAAATTTVHEEGIVGDGEDDGVEETPIASPAVVVVPPVVAKTGAQRLAQARRMRYKKTAAAPTAATISTPTEEGDNTVTTTTTTPPTTTTVDASTTATDPTTTTPNSTSSTTAPPTKKVNFHGVAKVRRRKLAEKKKMEETQQKTAMAHAKKNKVKTTVNMAVAPIVFQLLTILSLFMAGFDVGVQNHYAGSYQTGGLLVGPKVVTSYGFLDNGVSILSTLGLMRTTTNTVTTSLEDTTINMIHTDAVPILDSEDDEFQTTKPLGATITTTRQPNIDPVFNVDLDELTHDKSGFLMFLFRLAVRFHRSITYFLYLLPKSILQGIWSYTPFSSTTAVTAGGVGILSRRPVFALCAIVIRNIGKRVFGAADVMIDLETVLEMRLEAETGAGIAFVANGDGAGGDEPALGGIDSVLKAAKGGGKGLQNLDLMGMGIDYAKKFVEGNFPMVVVLYKLIQHVKTDMYVMMCGFFLGVVLPVGFSMGAVKEGGIGSEEL